MKMFSLEHAQALADALQAGVASKVKAPRLAMVWESATEDGRINLIVNYTLAVAQMMREE